MSSFDLVRRLNLRSPSRVTTVHFPSASLVPQPRRYSSSWITRVNSTGDGMSAAIGADGGATFAVLGRAATATRRWRIGRRHLRVWSRRGRDERHGCGAARCSFGRGRLDHRNLAAGRAQAPLGQLGELDEDAAREALQIGAYRVAVVGRLSGIPERHVERRVVSSRGGGRCRHLRRGRRCIDPARRELFGLGEVERPRHVAELLRPLRVARIAANVGRDLLQHHRHFKSGFGRYLSSAAVNGLLRSPPSVMLPVRAPPRKRSACRGRSPRCGQGRGRAVRCA